MMECLYRLEIITYLDFSPQMATLEHMKSEPAPDTLDAYLKNRRWRRLIERGQARARELGLTEADLPRLIAEYRREQRQGRG